MKQELDYKQIAFEANISKKNNDVSAYYVPAYEDILNKIKTYVSLETEGYNIYIVDNYSKYRIESIISTIEESLSGDKMQDICYVVKNDKKEPEPIILSKGKGVDLKSALEDIQSSYSELAINFYDNSIPEKDSIVKAMQKRRNDLVAVLLDKSKEAGFDVKPTVSGFSFVPLKTDEAKEKENSSTDLNLTDEVFEKLSLLKVKAREILETIKSDEAESLQKIKEVLLKYVVKEISPIKSKYFSCFEKEQKAMDYLKYVCENIERNLIEIYSTSLEEDEEKLKEVIYRYSMNVLVDNSERDLASVIFEEDPSLNNLMGTIEYESHNGSYVTDIKLMKAGTLLKANGGCLILRAASLFSNNASYHYLKKSLLNGKLRYDHTRGYLDLLTLNGLKPKPVDLNVKVILIGDYETYDLLYNMDEDFKYIFKVKLEYDPLIEKNAVNNEILINNLRTIIRNNSLLEFEDDAIKEVFRYLSRKAENRNKYVCDDFEIDKLLLSIDIDCKRQNKSTVKAQDVIDNIYESNLIEKHLMDSYKQKKLLLEVEDKIVGSVNGLSVIDMGYTSFGRPLRITCSCYRGDGNIVDVQKESNLSGNIHNKSVSILKGLINTLLGGYNSIPVDFHLSFEQIYGKVEGDSASVAEICAIISALSKLPVNQGIAVTGSINQFGEVQPVGGVNDKIEGFYNVCKLKGKIKDKGVLLPRANVENIVLKPEVEKAVKKGDFHIYAADTLQDALTVLMGDNKYSAEEIFDYAAKEIKKYSGRSKS